jgi:hypothetical protein
MMGANYLGLSNQNWHFNILKVHYKTAEVKITEYSNARLGHPVKTVKPFVNFKGRYLDVELLMLQHFSDKQL